MGRPNYGSLVGYSSPQSDAVTSSIRTALDSDDSIRSVDIHPLGDKLEVIVNEVLRVNL